MGLGLDTRNCSQASRNILKSQLSCWIEVLQGWLDVVRGCYGCKGCGVLLDRKDGCSRVLPYSAAVSNTTKTSDVDGEGVVDDRVE